MRIPKTIHMIWTGEPITPPQDKWFSSWISLHPQWQVKLWSESPNSTLVCGDEILTTSRPDLLDYSNKSYPALWGLRKCLWRIELLLQQGGVYTDVDTEPLKSIDDVIGDAEAVVSTLWQVPCLGLSCATSFLASTSGHAWIREILSSLTPDNLLRISSVITEVTSRHPEVKILAKEVVIQILLLDFLKKTSGIKLDLTSTVAIHHFLSVK